MSERSYHGATLALIHFDAIMQEKPESISHMQATPESVNHTQWNGGSVHIHGDVVYILNGIVASFDILTILYYSVC